jgi:hypothetical protein
MQKFRPIFPGSPSLLHEVSLTSHLGSDFCGVANTIPVLLKTVTVIPSLMQLTELVASFLHFNQSQNHPESVICSEHSSSNGCMCPFQCCQENNSDFLKIGFSALSGLCHSWPTLLSYITVSPSCREGHINNCLLTEALCLSLLWSLWLEVQVSVDFLMRQHFSCLIWDGVGLFPGTQALPLSMAVYCDSNSA